MVTAWPSSTGTTVRVSQTKHENEALWWRLCSQKVAATLLLGSTLFVATFCSSIVVGVVVLQSTLESTSDLRVCES